MASLLDRGWCKARPAMGCLLLAAFIDVHAQTSHTGPLLELGGTYQFVAANNLFSDNILDTDRNDGIAATLSVILQDTTSHGRGIGRLGFGLGAGAIWWDEELLLPIYGQLNWHPFIRTTPWCGVRLDRIGIIARFGALVGAWKETDTGQLSGYTFTDLSLRYPVLAKRRTQAWLSAGIGQMLLRGPYRVEIDGVVDESGRAEYIYPQLGLGLTL